MVSKLNWLFDNWKDLSRTLLKQHSTAGHLWSWVRCVRFFGRIEETLIAFEIYWPLLCMYHLIFFDLTWCNLIYFLFKNEWIVWTWRLLTTLSSSNDKPISNSIWFDLIQSGSIWTNPFFFRRVNSLNLETPTPYGSIPSSWGLPI